MSRKDIKLCGFGGQGNVLSGYILDKAASIFDKKEASLMRNDTNMERRREIE